MSWIQVQQTQQFDAEARKYDLTVVVSQSSGVPRELFVVGVSDDAYSHVAAFEDLTLYPAGKPGAMAAESDFYRDSCVVLRFDSAATAAAVSTAMLGRLKRVNTDWAAAQDAPFGGIETFIFDSETP